MSKNYCKVEHKWCKWCKKGHRCKYDCKIGDSVALSSIRKCPIREERETIPFREVLFSVSFNDIMKSMVKYWPDQEASKMGYRKVYLRLLTMHGKRTNWTIEGDYMYFDDYDENGNKLDTKSVCPEAYALRVNTTSENCHYAIDAFRWAEVVSMNVTRKTLNYMSYADFVAGTLYELTFNGFTEGKVQEFYDNLSKTYEEMKEQHLLDKK